MQCDIPKYCREGTDIVDCGVEAPAAPPPPPVLLPPQLTPDHKEALDTAASAPGQDDAGEGMLALVAIVGVALCGGALHKRIQAAKRNQPGAVRASIGRAKGQMYQQVSNADPSEVRHVVSSAFGVEENLFSLLAHCAIFPLPG
jgi:hypothetical protein